MLVQNKHEQSFLSGLLQPLPNPERKWDNESMDFIMGLAKVQGKDYIYVMVDQLMKFAHLFIISATYTIV